MKKITDILLGVWIIAELLLILFLIFLLFFIGSLIGLGIGEYLETLFRPRSWEYIREFLLPFILVFPLGGLWLGLSIGNRWAKWRKL